MADRETVIRGNQIKDGTVTETELSASVAGNGLSGGAGTPLALDLNELTGAVVAVADDSIAFVDATDNSTKKETIVDFITAIAGSGLTATAGVLSVNAIADSLLESDIVKLVVVATEGQTVMPSFSDGNPVVADSVKVFLNGLLQQEGEDYTIDFNTGIVTFAEEGWEETLPGGEGYEYGLNFSAISSDGNVLLTGCEGARLYLSTNRGISWAETQPLGNTDQDWKCGAVDSDGSVILVGIRTFGRLYLSTNSGTSWVETQPVGDFDKDWKCVAMNSDGSILIAGEGYSSEGRLHLSINGGTSWTEVQPAGNNSRNWTTVSMNSDGSVILAGCASGGSYSNGELYISINGGTSWTELIPFGGSGANIFMSAINADGSILLVSGTGEEARVYLSINGGTSWTEVQPVGDHAFSCNTGDISSDGNIIILEGVIDGEDSRNIYLSKNNGISWIETQPIENISWNGISLASDGKFALAVNGEGENSAYLYNSFGIPLNLGEIVTLQGILNNA